MNALALVLLLAADAPLRLTLEEAMTRARTSAPRVEAARSVEDAAEAAVRGARAARRPALELSASYARQSHVPELTVTLPGTGPRTLFPDLPDAWRSRAAVSVPLYTGGRITSGVDAATASSAAAEADVRAAENDVVLQTVDAYWSLATARASERVLAEALDAYESHLRDAQARFDEGLSARNELLAVQVERDRGELARRQAAHQADVAAEDLARLVGAAPGQRVETAEELVPSPPLAADVDAALAQRAELVALRRRAEAADAQARVARAGRRPQASASAAWEYANPNLRVLPLADRFEGTWSVGVGVTWTPWDGGRTSAAIAQAEALARAARHQLEDAERRVRVEIAARASALDTARAAVEVAERALAAARENVRVVADRHREGVATSSDLLDAETMLLRAGLEHTEAIAATQRARAALLRATGADPAR